MEAMVCRLCLFESAGAMITGHFRFLCEQGVHVDASGHGSYGSRRSFRIASWLQRHASDTRRGLEVRTASSWDLRSPNFHL